MKNLIFNSVAKTIVVVAVLVAFLGQSMAYASMACNMEMKSSHMSHQTMSVSAEPEHGMVHKGATHQSMNHSESQEENTCKLSCECPTNACSSVSLLADETMTLVDVRTSEPVIFNLLEQPISNSSSLYRPPILA